MLTGCEIMEQTFLCAGSSPPSKHRRMRTQDKVGECAALCARTRNCAGWTLGQVRFCWLLPSLECSGAKQGWTSGARACGEP